MIPLFTFTMVKLKREIFVLGIIFNLGFPAKKLNL